MKINHVLVAIDPVTEEVVHMSGYEDYPSEIDRENLREELSTDEAFECTEYAELLIEDGDEDDLAVCRGLVA